MSAKDSHEKLIKRYVRLRITALNRMIAETSMVLLAFANFVLFFTDFATAQPRNLVLLHFMRIGTILACLEYVPLAQRFGDLARAYAVLVHISIIASGAFLVHRAAMLGDVVNMSAPCCYFLTLGFLLTLGAPLNDPWTVVIAGIYIALGYVACSTPAGEFMRIAYINTFTLVAAAIVHVFIGTISERSARAEVEKRLQLAPIDIVRRATVSAVDNLSIQLPREPRHCICLASDWRGYQALSRRVSPEAIQAVLGRYYEMCRGLLTEQFPAGNYFSDWIADELLIFFVAERPEATGELAREALTFARRLILAKIAFAAVHGMPQGIDIGVATGRATIGLFGPVTNRKVMAVGRVAVDARRLQGVGKQYRTMHGQCDRLLYDSDLHAMAGLPAQARSLGEVQRIHIDAPPVRVLYEEPGREEELSDAELPASA